MTSVEEAAVKPVDIAPVPRLLPQLRYVVTRHPLVVFGAAFMGRDVYSRIIYGARISRAVGLGATALGCALGVALGLVSGFLGGWVDLVVQRLVDVMQALPVLVLALVMAAALGPSLGNTIVAISMPLAPWA